MTTLIYVDKENGALLTPAPSKQRGRLFSAPGSTVADTCLKTPASGKPLCGVPPQSCRRALGTVNKLGSTPSVSLTGRNKNKTPAIPTQKVKTKPQNTEEEYPEIEKLIPYNPLDFETYEVPEEVRLSHLCLAGLARFPGNPVLPEEEEFEVIDVCEQLAPMKMPVEDFSAELDSFLQTISQLTVDLPPEPEY
ncbi:securin isoform X1 [Anguilla rostrata]|uniref:securin isoform X1 n=1 Tax=Anguilla rostrata TaxID=7938 RepID=UPI0030D4B534